MQQNRIQSAKKKAKIMTQNIQSSVSVKLHGHELLTRDNFNYLDSVVKRDWSS